METQTILVIINIILVVIMSLFSLLLIIIGFLLKMKLQDNKDEHAVLHKKISKADDKSTGINEKLVKIDKNLVILTTIVKEKTLNFRQLSGLDTEGTK